MTENVSINTQKRLYLTEAQLKSELSHCLHCKGKPCMKACPSNCSPADFIALANAGDEESLAKSAQNILKSNPLGEMCGLTCPADKFCMKVCLRQNLDNPVKIPAVQAAILKKARDLNLLKAPAPVDSNGKSIAVVGAGPAGMAASAVLARKGYSVTILEASEEIGGAAKLIPDERLPLAVIKKDWEFIKSFGDIRLLKNVYVANPADLLKDGYDGVIYAVGTQKPTVMGIEGENLAIPFKAYLSSPAEYKTDGNVAVLGGGAVAADCAVTAKHLGALNVEMFVRRRIADMLLTAEDRQRLLDNYIDITGMTRVKKIVRTNKTFTLYTCKTRFNGKKLEDIPDTTVPRPDFTCVVMAVGSVADPKRQMERVIYAGDCDHGNSTVVEAVASGKNAAHQMHTVLTGEIEDVFCPVDSHVSYKAKSCTVAEGIEPLPASDG